MVKKKITSKVLDELAEDLLETLEEKILMQPKFFTDFYFGERRNARRVIKSILTDDFFEIDDKAESESISLFRVNRITKKLYVWVDTDEEFNDPIIKQHLNWQEVLDGLLYIEGALKRHIKVVDELDLFDQEDAKERIDIIPEMP